MVESRRAVPFSLEHQLTGGATDLRIGEVADQFGERAGGEALARVGEHEDIAPRVSTPALSASGFPPGGSFDQPDAEPKGASAAAVSSVDPSDTTMTSRVPGYGW